MSGSECTVPPISTVQLTVAGATRAWVSAENVLGIEEDVERQTLFRVGHYVHRGYGDASRNHTSALWGVKPTKNSSTSAAGPR